MRPLLARRATRARPGGRSRRFRRRRLPAPGIEATVYLPDAKAGYYRGTRFDWSGAVARLRWNKHEYFGEWFERHDPVLHDGITGPVEEFLTGDSALGYDEAKPARRSSGLASARCASRRNRLSPVCDLRDRRSRQVEGHGRQGPGHLRPRTARRQWLRLHLHEGAAAVEGHAGARASPEEHRPQADRDDGLQPQLLHDRQAAHRSGLRRALCVRAARAAAAGRAGRADGQGADLRPRAGERGDGVHRARGLRPDRRRLRHPRGEPQDTRRRPHDGGSADREVRVLVGADHRVPGALHRRQRRAGRRVVVAHHLPVLPAPTRAESTRRRANC